MASRCSGIYSIKPALFLLTACSVHNPSSTIYIMSDSTLPGQKSLSSQVQERYSKFEKACDQLSLIDQKIIDVHGCYKRSIRNKKHSSSYILQQRFKILCSMRCMFIEFINKMHDEIEILVFGGLYTDSESGDVTDSEMEDMTDSEEGVAGL